MAVETFTTLEQGRAQYAFKCAEEGRKIPRFKEYKSYCKKIPLLIKTNGLGAALAFISAKKSSDREKPGYAYQLLYQQISGWLMEDKRHLLAGADAGAGELVARVISLPSVQYRAVTREVLALCLWLKRFAEALIEGEAEE